MKYATLLMGLLLSTSGFAGVINVKCEMWSKKGDGKGRYYGTHDVRKFTLPATWDENGPTGPDENATYKLGNVAATISLVSFVNEWGKGPLVFSAMLEEGKNSASATFVSSGELTLGTLKSDTNLKCEADQPGARAPSSIKKDPAPTGK